FHLRNIAKLSSIVSRLELEIIIHAFISLHLVYCNSLFTCLSKTSMDRLQAVQNAAAKLLTKSSKWSHVTPLLISLHWLPKPYTPSRTLRSSDQGLLVIPHSRLKTKGDRAFEVTAPTL
ncbi:hypothetical protein LDENG_00286490, partial [Lucifuga dentata]